MVDYADLFDIEQRPGSGLELWTSTVERQLDRVRDANYRHRLHASTSSGEEQEEHPGAEISSSLAGARRGVAADEPPTSWVQPGIRPI